MNKLIKIWKDIRTEIFKLVVFRLSKIIFHNIIDRKNNKNSFRDILSFHSEYSRLVARNGKESISFFLFFFKSQWTGAGCDNANHICDPWVADTKKQRLLWSDRMYTILLYIIYQFLSFHFTYTSSHRNTLTKLIDTPRHDNYDRY